MDPNPTPKPGETPPKSGEPDPVDPKIAEIQKDPDAVQKLLQSKRDANEEAKKLRLKLEEFEKGQKAAADKALEEQGKFKELAEKHKAEAKATIDALKTTRLTFALQMEAVKAGALDVSDVVRLADLTALKLADDGETVEGAAELVEALKKSKPYLFKPVADPEPKPPVPPKGGPASLKGITEPADNDRLTPVQRIARGLAKTK